MNELFTSLLHAASVSGAAEPAAEIVKENCSKWADQVTEDVIGNVYVRCNPVEHGGIMMAAHMDEIGLMVNLISEDGFLHVYPVGGVKVCLYFGHIVRIHTRNGIIPGAVSISKSLYSQDAKAADIAIDIGCSTREEAEKLVEIGDVITYDDTDFQLLQNNRICGRAMDNKAGVYVITEALRRAKERGLKAPATAVTTVGEEVSMDGGYFAAARQKPQFCLVVDTTFAADHPHCSPREEYGDTALGKGPILSLNPIIKRAHIQAVKEIARAHNIPLQYETSGFYSCTDADKIHYTGEGVPVLILSIPLRNMHSPAETIDLGDVENLIELIANILLSYNPEA